MEGWRLGPADLLGLVWGTEAYCWDGAGTLRGGLDMAGVRERDAISMGKPVSLEFERHS